MTRVDIYNSADRAREAREAMLASRAARYKSWCGTGAYILSGIFFILTCHLFYGHLPSGESNIGAYLLAFSIWPFQVVMAFLEGMTQPAIITLIVLAIAYIVAYQTIYLVAAYQGIVYGLLYGVGGAGAIGIILKMMKVELTKLIIIILVVLAGIVFVFTFIKGLKGSFIRDI